MKASTIASYAAVIGVGFLAVRFAMKVKDGLDAGADAVKAAKDAAVKIISEELNPTSDKNLAYTGVNAIGAKVTGDESFALGSYVRDVQERIFKTGAYSSDVSNTKTQAAVMMAAQEEFRKSELKDERATEAGRQAEAATMAKRKADFRFSEILEQNYGFVEPTSFDKFLQSLQR